MVGWGKEWGIGEREGVGELGVFLSGNMLHASTSREGTSLANLILEAENEPHLSAAQPTGSAFSHSSENLHASMLGKQGRTIRRTQKMMTKETKMKINK